MAYRTLSPADADARIRAGTLRLIDVRPPAEREIAAVPVAHAGLEDGGLDAALALPRDTALAFLCHHGVRSAQAATYFAQQGFTDLYNVDGGIERWALTVDAEIPRY